MSTADHPQTDGQTERANRVLEEILRSYVHSFESWSEFLPMVEFAINNSVHASTGHTPFFVNGLRHPRLPPLLGSHPNLTGGGLPHAVDAVDEVDGEHDCSPPVVSVDTTLTRLPPVVDAVDKGKHSCFPPVVDVNIEDKEEERDCTLPTAESHTDSRLNDSNTRGITSVPPASDTSIPMDTEETGIPMDTEVDTGIPMDTDELSSISQSAAKRRTARQVDQFLVDREAIIRFVQDSIG
jgi:hypothetical protein